MLDPKRVIKIIIRYRLRNFYINILHGFLTVQIWKDFSLGWWKVLGSAWFPGVRHFENFTLWILLRLGLRYRAWKATNGHSWKLAPLSMALFSKFWSQSRYPICIHGSRPRCFTCIVEQVTSEVVDLFCRSGRPLACHFANTSVEMAKFICSASMTMFYINPWIQTALFLTIAIAGTTSTVSWQFAGWISLIPLRLFISISTDYISPLLTKYGVYNAVKYFSRNKELCQLWIITVCGRI